MVASRGGIGVNPLVRIPRHVLAPMLAISLAAFHPAESSALPSKVVREILISAALVGAGFALDSSVQGVYPDGVPDKAPGTLVEVPGEVFGAAPFLLGGTAALAVDGVAYDRPKSLQTAKELGIAMGASTLVGWSIKLVTQRERPDGSNHYSFPSGHAAVTFAAATVIDRRYGGAAGWIAYTAAAFASEARVADDHHYLSDVIAGAIIGRLIGRFVTRNP